MSTDIDLKATFIANITSQLASWKAIKAEQDAAPPTIGGGTMTLIRRSRFAPFSAQVRAYGGAFPKKVRAKAELVKVWVSPRQSECCSHAAEGTDCSCQDVTTRLTFSIGPLIKGGKAQRKVVQGEVTLVDGKFGELDFSWPELFSDSVRAIIGRDFSRLHDVEADIEAAVARKAAAV